MRYRLQRPAPSSLLDAERHAPAGRQSVEWHVWDGLGWRGDADVHGARAVCDVTERGGGLRLRGFQSAAEPDCVQQPGNGLCQR